jgi:hypothetical protein
MNDQIVNASSMTLEMCYENAPTVGSIRTEVELPGIDDSHTICCVYFIQHFIVGEIGERTSMTRQGSKKSRGSCALILQIRDIPKGGW